MGQLEPAALLDVVLAPYSNTALAEVIGTKPQVIGRWRHGRRIPGRRNRARLAAAMTMLGTIGREEAMARVEAAVAEARA